MTSPKEFTALIFLSGEDQPGITESLFSTLAPFALTILDIEQVVISNRLVLTALISCNPAHEKAIEADLMTCAENLGVDIATLFSETSIDSIASKMGLIHIVVLSSKLHPRSMAAISSAISILGGNIERISRTASTPVTAIELIVSGVNHENLAAALAPVAADNEVDIAVQPNGFSIFA